MLRKGGSAIDAGIATQMVLNLVEPQSSGIGGGAFMLYWDAAAKKLASYRRPRDRAAAATPELFLDADGKPLPREAAMASGLSVGVPGVLAALKLAHDKYGKLPWAELFQPAIDACPRRLSDLAPPRQDARRGRTRQASRRKRAPISSTRQGRPWPVRLQAHQSGACRHLRDDCPRRTRGLLRGRHRPRHRQAPCRTIRAGRASSRPKISPTTAPRSASRSACPIAIIASAARARPPPARVAVGQVLGLIAPFDLGAAPLGASPPISSPRPSGSPSPIARATSPIPISSRSRSRACSTRPISPSAAR